MIALRAPAMRSLSLALMIALAFPAMAQTASDKLPSQEELWQMLQAQHAQIEALKARIEQMQPTTPSATPSADTTRIARLETRITENEAKIEATGSMIDTALADGGVGGNGWWQRTTLGGYGELHYNGGNADQIDFHRFVLFAGHRFNDWLRLQSELEVEHADTEKDGAVELEQAFLEADLTSAFGLRLGENDRHNLRAGVFLVPSGIINETHEPPTFFGVERNRIESQIIPSTWREAGVGLNGSFGNGFSYDLATHSGLQLGSNFAVRSGRQSVSEAPANDVAYTGRLKWKGIPGVELGVSGQYQQDVTQGVRNIDATLLEAHADILRGGFGLRALYARWDLHGATDMKALGRDQQYGWYVEPSYRFAVSTGTLGVFARHERWDTQSGLQGIDTRFEVTSVGFNYWPLPSVVFKLDYQFENTPGAVLDDDRLNLGIGYQF